MKNLRALLQQLPSGLVCVPPDRGGLDVEIRGLATDSRACKPGDLFLGMPGTRVDGGTFWPKALATGAAAAVVSDRALADRPATDGSALVFAAPDMTRACAAIAAAFYDLPARAMQLAGVTGTNGKTTTTHLVEHFLQRGGRSVALLGTLYARWPGFSEVAAHTTPFAVELQGQLAAARSAGSDCAVMEVSSHALEQGRVLGCPFEAAVFTNLTQDHLDYHATMEAYFAAKAKLFSPDYLTGRAIVNGDDPYGQRLAADLGDRAWRFSLGDATADLYASDLEYGPTGVSGRLHALGKAVDFDLPLVGQFNLANLLAATGAALQLGVDLETITASLPEFTGVPGRMERVQVSSGQDIVAIVDYAHTPDSLQNMLRAARPFISGRAICVFGCGGDRDRTKRPQMGKIAAELADVAVVTSDNPRTEDPQQILQDVLAGIPATVEPIVLADRAEAIQAAIDLARPGDGVLIAGKGHEDYQILGTEKIYFDDREQARAALSARYGI